MLGCVCSSIALPSWFPFAPLLILFTVTVGLGIALLVATRPGRRERLGASLVGGSTILLLLSIAVAQSGRTSVTVEHPISGQEWTVICESALQAPSTWPMLDGQDQAACAAATATPRAATYVLLGVSGVLLAAGASMLVPTKDGVRRPKPPARPWPSHDDQAALTA